MSFIAHIVVRLLPNTMLPESARGLIAQQAELVLRDSYRDLDYIQKDITGIMPRGFSGPPPLCQGRLNQALIDYYKGKVAEVFETSKRVLETTRAGYSPTLSYELNKMLLIALSQLHGWVYSRKEPYPGFSKRDDIPRVDEAAKKTHDWLAAECNLLEH